MPSSLPNSLLRALSAFGLGLLTWTALTIALLQMRGGESTALQPLQWLALSLGGVLVVIGLVAHPAARGPRRIAEAPHALWTTRALRCCLLALLLTVGLVILLRTGVALPARGPLQALLAIALLTTCVTAAVAAGLGDRDATPPAAGRHPLALPTQLLIALAGGLALLYLLMSLLFVTGRDVGVMLLTLTVLGGLIAACLGLQWRDVDRATGAGAELPAHQRTSTRRWRQLTVALFVGAPLAVWLVSGLHLLPAPVLLGMTSGALLAAAVLTRVLLATPVAAPVDVRTPAPVP